MTATTLTAATTTSPGVALNVEQRTALALLANPGSDHPRTPYSLHRNQSRDAHRRIGKALVAAGRPDLLDSGPMRNLATIVASPENLRLHPADMRALIAVASAFKIGSLAMTMTLAGLFDDSMVKYRAQQAAASANA